MKLILSLSLRASWNDSSMLKRFCLEFSESFECNYIFLSKCQNVSKGNTFGSPNNYACRVQGHTFEEINELELYIPL